MEDLLSISTDQIPKLVIGDFCSILTPFLVAVPGSGRKVNLIYNLTRAHNYEVLRGTEVEDKLLALVGEAVPGVQLPTAMVLPKTVLNAVQIRVPEGPSFNKKRRDPNLLKPTWFSANSVDRVCDIPSIMPVPAFLVYDLFEEEGDTTIYSHITNQQVMRHWIKKGRFQREDLDQIDWQNQEKAMKLATLTTRRFVTKWASGWIGTGKNMKRWKLRPHGYCPYCKMEDEDTFHIMQCLHTEATQHHHDALWTWISSMIKIGTCPHAIRAIKNEITAWRTGSDPPNIDTLNPSLHAAILSQRNIGWKSFLEGLFSIHWKQYQQEYFDESGSRRSPNLWVSKAIRHCWKYLFTLWVCRNQQLHNTDHILDMEGRKEMIKAIHDEYNIGLGRLPAYGFSYMFKSTPEELSQASMAKIKHWLSIIKQGRIVYEDPQRIEDDFFIQGALHKTLDLIELNEDEFDMNE